jgi:hypothetical protein
MTTFEYFKAQYDKAHDYMIECIHKEIPVDSFHFVEVAAKFAFGGTTDVDAWFNIRGVDDTQEMRTKKFVAVSDGYRNSRLVRKVTLTKKGLREFYKEMF